MQWRASSHFSSLLVSPSVPHSSEPPSPASVQNGRNPYSERPGQSRGLASKSGSEGCILRNPNPQVSSTIPQVQFKTEMLSVPMPPIWPVARSMGLYQDPETSTSSPSGDGGTIDSIHRRHPCPGGVQGGCKKSGGRLSIPPTVPGFPDKPEKIGVGTGTSDGIPGLNSGHCPDGAEAPCGEDSCGITITNEGRACLRESPGSFSGEDECSNSSHTTSPTLLSPPSDGTVRHTRQKLPVLRGTGSPYTILQGGTDVVGHPHDKMEWKIPSQEGSGSGNRFRCILDRMGCSVPEPTDRRPVVSGRAQDAHQLPGVTGRDISGTHIPEEQNQDVSTPQIGQHHGSGICKQSRRDSLQGIGRLSKGPVDVVPGEEHSHHSATPTRCTEYDS